MKGPIHEGAYPWRGLSMEGPIHGEAYPWRGLSMEGPIHERAYFRNFTVDCFFNHGERIFDGGRRREGGGFLSMTKIL